MMNAMTLVNRSLSAGLVVLLLAAALPALNSDVITPFEGFVMTPLIMMLATLGGVALNSGLGRLQRQLRYRMTQPARSHWRQASECCDVGACPQHGMS